MEIIVKDYRYDNKGRIIHTGYSKDSININTNTIYTEDENGNIASIEEKETTTNVANKVLKETKTIRNFEYKKIENKWMCTKIIENGRVKQTTKFDDFGTGRGITIDNYETTEYSYSNDGSLESKTVTTNYTDKDGTKFTTIIYKDPDDRDTHSVSNTVEDDIITRSEKIDFDYSSNIGSYTIMKKENIDENHYKCCVKQYTMDIDSDEIISESGKDYTTIEYHYRTENNGRIIDKVKYYDITTKEYTYSTVYKRYKEKLFEGYDTDCEIEELYYTSSFDIIDDTTTLIHKSKTVILEDGNVYRSCFSKNTNGEVDYYENYNFEVADDGSIRLESSESCSTNNKPYNKYSYVYYKDGNIAMITREMWETLNSKNNGENSIIDHEIFEYDEKGNAILRITESSSMRTIYSNGNKEFEIIEFEYPKCKEIFNSYYNKIIDKI